MIRSTYIIHSKRALALRSKLVKFKPKIAIQNSSYSVYLLFLQFCLHEILFSGPEKRCLQNVLETGNRKIHGICGVNGQIWVFFVKRRESKFVKFATPVFEPHLENGICRHKQTHTHPHKIDAKWMLKIPLPKKKNFSHFYDFHIRLGHFFTPYRVIRWLWRRNYNQMTVALATN